MRRSKTEIMSNILEVCLNGTNKARIVYQVNLNFKTVNPYLEFLNRRGLIIIEDGPRILYRTTNLGISLLKDIQIIQRELGQVTVGHFMDDLIN